MMITAAAKPNWYDAPVEWVLGTPLQVIIILVAVLLRRVERLRKLVMSLPIYVHSYLRDNRV